ALPRRRSSAPMLPAGHRRPRGAWWLRRSVDGEPSRPRTAACTRCSTTVLKTGDVEAGLLIPLAVLALIDSTSFGTLLIPLWLLLSPGRPSPHRVLLFLGTVAAFY